jgi:hypothetical protein
MNPAQWICYFFRSAYFATAMVTVESFIRHKLHSSSRLRIMKNLERITIATTGAATLVAAAYLVQKAIRVRLERVLRVAAGESPYERKHSKLHQAKPA